MVAASLFRWNNLDTKLHFTRLVLLYLRMHDVCIIHISPKCGMQQHYCTVVPKC